jgi:hypothetical protein
VTKDASAGSLVHPHEMNLSFKTKVQTDLSLIRPKRYPPKLKKFQIKYGSSRFEIRNNFPFWHFSIFEIEFELIFRELLWIEFNLKYLGISRFNEIWPVTFYLHLVAR